MAQKWDKFIRAFITNQGYKTVLDGFKSTMEIALFGFLIGIAIGALIAIIKVSASRNKFMKGLSVVGDVYVGFFRGTPIIVQLLLVYYVLFPAMGVSVDKLVVGIVTFGFNSGAYVSEIMRAGIKSVDVGQMEAGRSLGLSYMRTMAKVVLPQAVKNTLPTLGNELIALVKDTSVVGFIAVTDLTQAFKLIGAGTYEYIIPYVMLALVYLVIVLCITGLIKLAERRLAKSDRRK